MEFQPSRMGKEEIHITNILSTELAESVLEVSLLLAQIGSSSELSLFTYGLSKTPDIGHAVSTH